MSRVFRLAGMRALHARQRRRRGGAAEQGLCLRTKVDRWCAGRRGDGRARSVLCQGSAVQDEPRRDGAQQNRALGRRSAALTLHGTGTRPASSSPAVQHAAQRRSRIGRSHTCATGGTGREPLSSIKSNQKSNQIAKNNNKKQSSSASIAVRFSASI